MNSLGFSELELEVFWFKNVNKAQSFVLCCWWHTHTPKMVWKYKAGVCGRERRLSSSTSDEDLGRKLRVPHLRSQHLRTCLQMRKRCLNVKYRQWDENCFVLFLFLRSAPDWPCAEGSRYGSLRKSRAGWCDSLLQRVHRGEVRGCVGGFEQHVQQPEM